MGDRCLGHQQAGTCAWSSPGKGLDQKSKLDGVRLTWPNSNLNREAWYVVAVHLVKRREFWISFSLAVSRHQTVITTDSTKDKLELSRKSIAMAWFCISDLTIAVIMRTKAPRIIKIVCAKSVQITAERPEVKFLQEFFTKNCTVELLLEVLFWPPPIVKTPAIARRIRIARYSPPSPGISHMLQW